MMPNHTMTIRENRISDIFFNQERTTLAGRLLSCSVTSAPFNLLLTTQLRLTHRPRQVNPSSPKSHSCYGQALCSLQYGHASLLYSLSLSRIRSSLSTGSRLLTWIWTIVQYISMTSSSDSWLDHELQVYAFNTRWYSRLLSDCLTKQSISSSVQIFRIAHGWECSWLQLQPAGATP